MISQTTPISPAVPLPADVRAAGPEARKLYAAAAGFEQLLLRQLASVLTESQGLGGDEEGAASTLLREQLPEAFAQSLTAAGGLGLARPLYESLRQEQSR